MKKITSLLLTAVLLVTVLTVFSVPSSAEGDEPVEIDPTGSTTLTIAESGNYIIKKDCKIYMLSIANKDATLTIAKGVTVTVSLRFTNDGTLDLCGTLVLSDGASTPCNDGRIRLYCTGALSLGNLDIGKISGVGEITDAGHDYHDGVCTVCGKAYDPNEPIRIWPNQNGIQVKEAGNYIIDGSCTVSRLKIDDENATLIIAPGVTVTVTNSFDNDGTLDLRGTLNVSRCYSIYNSGSLRVDCTGAISDDLQLPGDVTYAEHTYENGVCTVCGKVYDPNEPIRLRPKTDARVEIENPGNYIIANDCTLRELNVRGENSTLTIASGVTVTVTTEFSNSAVIEVCGTLDVSQCRSRSSYNRGTIRVACNGSLNGNVDNHGYLKIEPHHYVCDVCGAETSSVTGSVLSEGSLTIVVGVACLAIGFLAAMFIFKKKKPTVAEGAEDTDEE